MCRGRNAQPPWLPVSIDHRRTKRKDRGKKRGKNKTKRIQEYVEGLTDGKVRWYTGRMAKYIVKAVTHRTQVRISVPVMLLKEMGWTESAMFILEKASEEEVRIKQLYRKRDLK